MPLPALTLSLQFAPFGQLQVHRQALPRHAVRRWLRHAMQPDVQTAELTVRIVGEDEGRQLNRDWRHKDYATNVLTFDYEPAPALSADLVLCGPVVQQQAREQGKSLQAHYAHLIVHGGLHAQGYDHEREPEARVMEGLEIAVLARLGFANPY